MDKQDQSNVIPVDFQRNSEQAQKPEPSPSDIQEALSGMYLQWCKAMDALPGDSVRREAAKGLMYQAYCEAKGAADAGS